MQKTAEQEKRKLSVRDDQMEVAITCRPYGSSGALPTSGGVMRGFTEDGLYIETTNRYNEGTILVVRVDRYPSFTSSLTKSVPPRSICLAEVQWQKELIDDKGIRFGLGLRYLH